MFQGLTSRKSLSGIDNKELFNQVDDILRALFELDMVKVKLASLDLVEHLLPVGPLEWEIAAHKNVE